MAHKLKGRFSPLGSNDSVLALLNKQDHDSQTSSLEDVSRENKTAIPSSVTLANKPLVYVAPPAWLRNLTTPSASQEEELSDIARALGGLSGSDSSSQTQPTTTNNSNSGSINNNSTNNTTQHSPQPLGISPSLSPQLALGLQSLALSGFGNITNSPLPSAIQHKLKQKKRRRRRDEIDRKYQCPIEGCNKSYGSEGAVKTHLRLKHQEQHQLILQLQQQLPQHYQLLSQLQAAMTGSSATTPMTETPSSPSARASPTLVSSPSSPLSPYSATSSPPSSPQHSSSESDCDSSEKKNIFNKRADIVEDEQLDVASSPLKKTKFQGYFPTSNVLSLSNSQTNQSQLESPKTLPSPTNSSDNIGMTTATTTTVANNVVANNNNNINNNNRTVRLPSIRVALFEQLNSSPFPPPPSALPLIPLGHALSPRLFHVPS